MSLGDVIASDASGIYQSCNIELFSDNKRALISRDNKAVIWDFIKDEFILEIEHIDNSTLRDVKLSNDETIGVSACRDEIKVWDIETGNIITTFAEHTDYIMHVTISKDDSKIISSSANEVYVWEIATNNILVTFTEHNTGGHSLGISPDGTKIASAGNDTDLLIWDISNGDILYTLTGHTGNVSALDFHPDGDKIITGSYDSTVKVWDISSGEILNEFTEHTDKVNTVSYFPDGQIAVTGGRDEILYIWDLERNQVLFDIESTFREVNNVTCNNNGAIIGADKGKQVDIIELINFDSLIFTNEYGQIYNTDPDYLSKPIELGRALITEDSDILEVYFKNNKEVAIKDVLLSADNEKSGTDLTFSKLLSPFDELQTINFAGPYQPSNGEVFYVKLNTTLEAAKGDNSVTIKADADFDH